jgi:prepilin-type N-terminal cleavage/methylation domain-containing protein
MQRRHAQLQIIQQAPNDVDRASAPVCPRGGFTLLEWLITIAILGILLSLGSLTFHRAAEASVMAQARNAIVTYAQIARSYALAHRVEAMLVVNPFNGRFEVWYSSPPVQGGPWDPLKMTYAPILDPAARLPQVAEDQPAASVHPIDYQPTERPSPAVDPGESFMDNLTWAAFCFDERGQLVVRTRRIATRTFLYRNGTERPAVERNRLRDESPDLSILLKPDEDLVTDSDTAITSTRGFVISESLKMKVAISPGSLNPYTLVNDWLMQTREGGPYQAFAEAVVLNHFSGQQVLGTK